MVAAANNISIKASSLKKSKKRTAISVAQYKGTVSFQMVSAKKGKKSFKKKIKVDPSTGQITLKKGLKKGTYKVKVNVYDTGDDSTNAGVQQVAFKVKVK